MPAQDPTIPIARCSGCGHVFGAAVYRPGDSVECPKCGRAAELAGVCPHCAAVYYVLGTQVGGTVKCPFCSKSGIWGTVANLYGEATTLITPRATVPVPPKPVLTRHADSELYGEAMAEIDRPEGPDRGVMAKALTMAEGDTVKARALYVRYRVEQMQRHDRGAWWSGLEGRIVDSLAARAGAAGVTWVVLICVWSVPTQILYQYTHFGRCLQVVLFVWALAWPWVFFIRRRASRFLRWQALLKDIGWALLADVGIRIALAACPGDFAAGLVAFTVWMCMSGICYTCVVDRSCGRARPTTPLDPPMMY